VAAAFAAADALLAVYRTGDVLKFVEFHVDFLFGGAARRRHAARDSDYVFKRMLPSYISHHPSNRDKV